MLFSSLFTAICLIAHTYCDGSRKVLNHRLSAFLSASNLGDTPCRPTRRSAFSTSPSRHALDTRKAVRSLQTRALHDDLVPFLQDSSRILYETFSRDSHASPAECLMASAAYVLPLMESVEVGAPISRIRNIMAELWRIRQATRTGVCAGSD